MSEPATDERFQCSDNPMRNEGITRLIAESQSVSVMMGSMWENCLRLIARVRQEQERSRIHVDENNDKLRFEVERLRALVKEAVPVVKKAERINEMGDQYPALNDWLARAPLDAGESSGEVEG